MVIGAFCVVLSFIPCFCLSAYQAFIAFFIWSNFIIFWKDFLTLFWIGEKNKYVTPGFLGYPSTLVLRSFKFVEANTIDIIKNTLCKKK